MKTFILSAFLACIGCGAAEDFAPKAEPTAAPTGAPGQDGAPGAAGEAGRSGADGAPGAAGKAGATGATGTAGASGAAGAPGVAGPRGQGSAPGLGDPWTDPDSGKAWVIVSLSVTFANAQCPAGMVLPPLGLPYKLLYHFMAFASTQPDSLSYWTSTGGTIGEITFTFEGNGAGMGDTPVTESHALICKEP